MATIGGVEGVYDVYRVVPRPNGNVEGLGAERPVAAS
jgi:hypothetical protein